MEISKVKEITDYNGNFALDIMLKNVELKWAKLAEPSEMSNKYEVTIELTDEAVAEEYKKLCKQVWDEYKKAKKLKVGPQAKGYGEVKDEDGNPTGVTKIVAKAIYESQKGKIMPPPLVVDTAKQKIDLANYQLIGNGTVANVKIQVQPYEFNKQHGVSVKLIAVQILKLVEYTGGAEEALDDFDEFEDDDFLE